MNNEFVFTIPSIRYDPKFLMDYVNDLKPYRRIKILPWRNLEEYQQKLKGISIDDPKIPASVVTNRNDFIVSTDQNNLNYDFSKDSFINNILNKTELKDNEVHNIEIVYYKKDYIFHPHTDAAIKCKIMMPASLESNEITPVDFYTLKQGEVKIGTEYQYQDVDLTYKYRYSNSMPSVINTHSIHGVEKMLRDRTMITIGLLIDFETFYKKCLYLDLV